MVARSARLVAAFSGTVPRGGGFLTNPLRSKTKDAREMTIASIHKSAPDRWSSPRPHTDATLRRLKYGAIRPMEEPGFLRRLFGG
ncbi:MAG: hypothetical protein WA985_06190 [Erythrobacter sp.]